MMRMRSLTSTLALALVAAFLSGCVTLPDPEASQEFSRDVVGVVDGLRTVGQTFVARRPRLNGVELWLERDPAAALTVELFHTLAETRPLVSIRLGVSDLPASRPVRLLFAAQDDPPGQGYVLRLRSSGPPVRVLGRNEDAYPAGQALLDGQPVEADLAFRLLYDYDAGAMLGDLGRLVPRAWLALPLAALLLLPGWLLLDLLGLRRQFDGGEQAALAAGLSLALVPLLLLWTTVVGLRWSRPSVITVAVLLAALALWRATRPLLRPQPPTSSLQPPTPNPQPPTPNPQPPTWPLAAIFALTLAVRLAMVRDLAAPAWVDSVHHALITRLIVEEGALPDTYAPVLDLDTASYHFGFHSQTAAFHWLSGLDVAGAMLLFGQALNALMAVAAYLFAREVTGDRTTGLVAALVVGLASPMPAYYASWGRYTQLAGLAILPAALALARRAVFTSPLIPVLARRAVFAPLTTQRGRFLLLAAAALAGLVLTHNRVAAFYGCFLLAYLLAPVEGYGRDARWRRLADRSLRLGVIGGGAAALTLPWLLPALATLWLPKLRAWSGVRDSVFYDFSWRYLTAGLGKYVLAVALLGLVWALVRRRRFALTLALWVGFLFFLASLGPWGLPGGGFVNYTSVEIALFLPLATLAGYVVSRLLAAWREALSPRWGRLYRGVVTLLAVGLALFGARTLLPILNVETALFRQADGPAIAWIREHTPDEARFLINPMPWSAYGYAGRDGGYWIGPLTGRPTLPPPVLYGLAAPPEVQAINELCASVIQDGEDPAALWTALRAWEITHVYVGARGGALSAQALAASALFRPLYARDGVWVFAVLREAP